MAEFERISLVKPEIFIYQLPPRVSNRAVRAADWDLPNPSWKGRLKVISKGNECIVKLEDRSGELFAMCPVEAFPGVAVEPVSDSSRYFILRLLNPSGQHAFVGLGFEERGDAFDFNVALQDHFKQVKQTQQIAKEQEKPMVHKDYSLKEGQKITINLKKTEMAAEKTSKGPQPAHQIGLTSTGALLPPPPASSSSSSSASSSSSTATGGQDDWGDFASFGANAGGQPNKASNNEGGDGGNWVQF